MKRLFPIVLAGFVGMFGCRHPDQVLVGPGTQDSSSEIVLTPLGLSDTTILSDSTKAFAVDPEEDITFGARLTVQRTINDYATLTGARKLDTLDFSSAVFLDWSRPEGDSVREHVGYYGDSLASLTLNGISMLLRSHQVRASSIGDAAWGVEYWMLLHGMYQARSSYNWQFKVHDTDAASAVSVQSPDDLVLHYPVGGTRIPRASPVMLRWTGTDSITITISEFFPIRGTARKLLLIQPAVNRGQLELSTRILQMLPVDHQSYVITFVLYRRKAVPVVSGYSGKTLAEATVVYNCYVEIY